MKKYARVSFLCFCALVLVVIIAYTANAPQPHLVPSGFLHYWAQDFECNNNKSRNGTVSELEASNMSLSVVNGTKSILLWNHSWGYRFGTGRYPFVVEACPVSNCIITQNSSYIKDLNFDAFVIHLPTQKKPWPLKSRRPDQIFVFFSTEPPAHMPKLDAFEDYFNWTMTYRSDSDFHLKYGEIVPLPGSPRSADRSAQLRRDIVAANVDPGRGKTKLAVWLVSNCKTQSKREDYIVKLRKLVPVDIFSRKGRCGGKDVCARDKNGDVCYDLIETNYKFYFSFENSICHEYVTEKFFEMMGRNIVPVVLGGANYASIAPPHSYINAMDYTPEELADYLLLLDRSPKLYAEYFWWKPYYRVRNLVDINKQVFCELCAALHRQPLMEKTATGLNKWYHQDSNCLVNPKF